ncbi:MULTISPECIES: class F sortase [Bacillus]|uniref:class F sortase n=1 Tax=Bacillus TaxID=1386 RepID=UPI0012FE9BD7|nr:MULTISPECIES: class F sortase [Bacillus]
MRNLVLVVCAICSLSYFLPTLAVASNLKAKPVKIQIPKLQVETSIYAAPLSKEGKMEITDNADEVAWFSNGISPGMPGSAVIAGHVDNYTGPAIFFYLKRLKQGDSIFITDEFGDRLEFIVEKVEKYPYDQAPIQLIFGPSTRRKLNLITCTGKYDRKTNVHAERLVVYSEMKVSEGN